MSEKKLHKPWYKHKIVAWNHWGKKDSEAQKLTLEEIKEWSTQSHTESPQS